MKYLDIAALDNLNAFLQSINLGDHVIGGRLNCYSLKMVQRDKKLVKHLQREYSNEKIMQHHINKNRVVNEEQLDDSIQKLSQVNVGNLHEFSTVRLISYFISTLNNTYPDFDFTDTPPNQFKMEQPQIVNETVNARLSPLTKSKPLLMDSFWKTIDEIMHLNECSFYSFKPNDDVLEVLRTHSLWNIDYFVVNEKKKQLLYLSLHAQNCMFNKIKLMDDFKTDDMNDMDIDIDEENVDDGMAYLPPNDMSPSPKQLKQKNHQKKDINNHNYHSFNSVHHHSFNNNKNHNNYNHNHGANNHLNQHKGGNKYNQNQKHGKRHLNNNNNHNHGGTQLHVMSVTNCLSPMPPLESVNSDTI